jgi:hypothetical protein
LVVQFHPAPPFRFMRSVWRDAAANVERLCPGRNLQGAFTAHSTMSKQVLDSENVRSA